MTKDGRAAMQVLPDVARHDNEFLRRFALGGPERRSRMRPARRSPPGPSGDSDRGGLPAGRGLFRRRHRPAPGVGVAADRDVVLTMLPVLLSGLLTFATCAVFDLPLNFANIIALPLAVRRGRRLQHLFRDGLARGRDGDAEVEPDARRGLQRAHDRQRLRRALALDPSRHRQHGPAADDLAGLGASGHAPVPAGPARPFATEQALVLSGDPPFDGALRLLRVR